MGFTSIFEKFLKMVCFEHFWQATQNFVHRLLEFFIDKRTADSLKVSSQSRLLFSRFVHFNFSSSVTDTQHPKEGRHPLRRLLVRWLLIPDNQLALLDLGRAGTYMYIDRLCYIPRIPNCILLAECLVLRHVVLVKVTETLRFLSYL
jgi:hypothetical protein